MYIQSPIYIYNRRRALAYSNEWALKRNPNYFDYENIGGDCTNFISQCIYAGSQIMNYDYPFGWFYIDSNNKAPSWTGVPYLYNFLTRTTGGPGPYGIQVDISVIEEGDIIQLAFQEKGNFAHSLFIVECGTPPSIYNIFVNTHTDDQKHYPLTQYYWDRIRFIKILGVRG